jgi:hypothetical protein
MPAPPHPNRHTASNSAGSATLTQREANRAYFLAHKDELQKRRIINSYLSGKTKSISRKSIERYGITNADLAKRPGEYPRVSGAARTVDEASVRPEESSAESTPRVDVSPPVVNPATQAALETGAAAPPNNINTPYTWKTFTDAAVYTRKVGGAQKSGPSNPKTLKGDEGNIRRLLKAMGVSLGSEWRTAVDIPKVLREKFPVDSAKRLEPKPILSFIKEVKKENGEAYSIESTIKMSSVLAKMLRDPKFRVYFTPDVFPEGSDISVFGREGTAQRTEVMLDTLDSIETRALPEGESYVDFFKRMKSLFETKGYDSEEGLCAALYLLRPALRGDYWNLRLVSTNRPKTTDPNDIGWVNKTTGEFFIPKSSKMERKMAGKFNKDIMTLLRNTLKARPTKTHLLVNPASGKRFTTQSAFNTWMNQKVGFGTRQARRAMVTYKYNHERIGDRAKKQLADDMGHDVGTARREYDYPMTRHVTKKGDLQVKIRRV